VGQAQSYAEQPPLCAWALISPGLWISRWLDEVSQDCGLFIIASRGFNLMKIV
jgi:hypothetical protein